MKKTILKRNHIEELSFFKTKKNIHLYLLNKATPAIKVFFFFAEKSLVGGEAKEHNLELVTGTEAGPLQCKVEPLAQSYDVGHSLGMHLVAIRKKTD